MAWRLAMSALSPKDATAWWPTMRPATYAFYRSGKMGAWGEATDTVQFSGSGPNPERQEGPHAHMILPSPDRGFILAVDLGTDRLDVVPTRYGDAAGLIPADSPWTQMPPGTGPRHLAFHPHRPFTYVINELQSTVTVLRSVERGGRVEAVHRPFQPYLTISKDQNSGRGNQDRALRSLCVRLEPRARQPGDLCRRPGDRPVDACWA